MVETLLSQVQADALISMEKKAIDQNEVSLPDLGGSIVVPLISTDSRESFLLNVRRARLDLRKGTHQLRARQTVVLIRLDFGGAPHRNPDDQEIGSPHIHLYREGYEDKWAFPIPKDVFLNIEDHWQTLNDFLTYCNVSERPNFRRGLFS